MIRFLKIIIWISVLSGIIFYVNYTKFIDFKLNQSKIITVVPGDTLVSALEREISLSTLYFKVYLKLHPEQKINIQVGQYSILKGDNIESILKTISVGSMTVDKKISLLEGWNIFDIDEYLTQNEFIKKGEFISEAKNVEKYKEKFSFLKQALSLEGYLYPDTYFVNPNNFILQDFNEKMLENFRKKTYDNLLSTLSKEQLNEVIILASILEKEERNLSQKSTVAGILKKRYRENWFIGADITACYHYQFTANDCKMNLSKYIGEKNEYNTRTMIGLPKTAISNPSFESVNAVINSKDTPYYYYLHDTTNGQVYYAKTNEEHIKNKKLYIK